MALYKYVEPRWAAAMVEEGALRIGTLYEFRRQEAYGKDRGDLEEGLRITQTDGREAKVQGAEVPAFLRASLRIPDNVALHVAEGAVIRQHASVPDMYVYCMCSRYDAGLLNTFGGACVEIHDVERFFAAVTGVMSEFDECGVRRTSEFQIAPCEYNERVQTWPNAIDYHPVFRKPPWYSHQDEVRAVWITACREIGPVNITVPEIRRYCRRIA